MSLGRTFIQGILVMAALSAMVSHALDPALAPSQYVRQHWDRSNGLPDTSIFAITQTRDGYLWIGTEMGLVRFDGARFVLYGAGTTPAFETSMVMSLLETREGRLLIGTRTGLIEYEGGAFRRVRGMGSAERSVIWDLHEDGAGRVWVGCDGELGYIEAGAFHTFIAPGGLHLRGVAMVRESEDGTLWFLDGAKIYRWKGGQIETTSLPDVTRAIAVGRRGDVWAFPLGGLLSLAGTAEVPKDLAALRGRTVVSVLEDRDGTLWLGNLSGLLLCRGGHIMPVQAAPGDLTAAKVFFEDREGSLWIGTLGYGLWCLHNPRIKSFGKPEGLDVGYVNTIIQAGDGAFWIGTQDKGLVRWKDGEVVAYGQKDGLPHHEIGTLLEDSKGVLWVGTPGGLVRHDGKGRFIAVSLPLKETPAVYALAQLTDGTLLAGTSEGVLALRDQKWTTLDTPQGFGLVLDIESDPRGGAWFATLGRGLFHWDGRTVKAYGAAEGLASSDLPCLHMDARGRLWIGTANRGLVLFDGKRFHTLGPAQGLAEGPIYGLLEAEGSLWMSGKSGITRLPVTQVEAWLGGSETKVQPMVYGEAEGMREAECNGGYEPSAWRARDGKLWFPTQDGVVAVDPKRLTKADTAPAVLLEEVLVSGKPAHAEAGAIQLPPGRANLEIHYTAAVLASPQKVRFAYRMEGFDHDWVDAGERRVAYYTNLPAGRYRFLVRAATGDSGWAEPQGALAVAQPPEFWQTWLFRFAAVAAMLIFFHFVYRMRVRIIRRRFAAVLEERTRISRDIHDSLTQGFAGVLLSLEAAERARAAGGEASWDRVRHASAMARQGLEEARRMVKGLRPLHLDGEDLVAALEQVTRSASAESSFEATFRSEGPYRRLAPALEDHLLRITQESLANAARYAEAARVQVSLAVEKRAVTLAIQDDGIGFDPQAAVSRTGGGFGLMGMKERTEQMKGTFTLKTSPGKGTRIEVRVPL